MAGHSASTVKKHMELNASVQITHSLSIGLVVIVDMNQHDRVNMNHH